MNRTELNPINHFADKTSISDQDYQRLRNKAVAYQGIDESLIDEMIANAEQAVTEAQVNFQTSIDDQVERAILIIESDVGPDSLARENSHTLYNLIGVINAENPDIDEANQLVDEMAIKLSRIFNAVKERELADEADFDDHFDDLEDRYGNNPFDSFGEDRPEKDVRDDGWPNF